MNSEVLYYEKGYWGKSVTITNTEVITYKGTFLLKDIKIAYQKFRTLRSPSLILELHSGDIIEINRGLTWSMEQQLASIINNLVLKGH
jgi:hypothetical protein